MNHLVRIEHTQRLGDIVAGVEHNIGEGFSALHFSEEMFGTHMDPLLMVDHFVMTQPTFAPHLHAGISAVSALFEDSEGAFLNRDTLGHNIALKAGDLYWLAAASGAAHEETPDTGARVHALQLFVNLPARLKQEPARTLHVPAGSIPVLLGDGHRVRVVLGQSGDATGAQGTPEPLTLLDGFLDAQGAFTHALPEGEQAWIYSVSGSLTLACEGETRTLPAGHATTVASGAALALSMTTEHKSHFVLIAGRPISEPFVKRGPLVITTEEDVRRTLAKYAQGEFGRIPD